MDFPKQEKVDRSIVRADLHKVQMSIVEKVETGRAWQECEYLVRLAGKDEDDAAKNKEKEAKDPDEEDQRDYRYEGTRMSWRDVYEPADTNKILEVHDALTGALLWSKAFNKVIPAIYTDASANVAAFRWRLYSDGAKAEMKTMPTVLRPERGDRDDDYLIEVVDLHNGKFLNAIIIDTANGAINLRRYMATMDWVVVYDSIGRTLVYSLKTGKCVDKLFGTPRNLSLSGTLVVQHDPGHLTLHDLNTSEKVDVTLPFPVSSTFFTRNGKKLLLLTNDQVVYTINTVRPESAVR